MTDNKLYAVILGAAYDAMSWQEKTLSVLGIIAAIILVGIPTRLLAVVLPFWRVPLGKISPAVLLWAVPFLGALDKTLNAIPSEDAEEDG